jgi:hypothetical protein
MKSYLVKLGFLAAACALLVATFSIIGPKVVKAAVATLVQVVNTSANPVPTQEIATQILLNDVREEIGFANDNIGPVDVSGAKQIRVSMVATGTEGYKADAVIYSVLPDGFVVYLGTVTGPNPTQTFETPGTQIKIALFNGSMYESQFTTVVYARSN